jgi:hypothetical protein
MGEKTFSPAITEVTKLPGLDHATTERVTQWVTRWHSAEYDADEISEMLEDWPSDVPLVEMIDRFGDASESESPAALAEVVTKLVPLVARGRLQATQAKGAIRLACRQLCVRGIPFEETAKGNEAALWFHFLAINEFGDPTNVGYATDLSELLLMARQIIEPDELTEKLIAGGLPPTFHEAYVNTAGALGDARLVPQLLTLLNRCDDAQSVATVVAALGRLADQTVVPVLEGYAYSMDVETATATVMSLENIGGDEAKRILETLAEIIADKMSLLSAHVDFALLKLERGADELHEALRRTAADADAPPSARLCAIERLSGSSDPDVIRLLADLLDDPYVERVTVDGNLTDDAIYPIREASYVGIMDCRISYLVEVLDVGILDRLESFQTYSVPSWWGTIGTDNDLFRAGQ